MSGNNHKSSRNEQKGRRRKFQPNNPRRLVISRNNKDSSHITTGRLPFCNGMAIGNWRRRCAQLSGGNLDRWSISATCGVHQTISGSASVLFRRKTVRVTAVNRLLCRCNDDESRCLLIVYFQIRAPNPSILLTNQSAPVSKLITE